jgi:hypothetical protein
MTYTSQTYTAPGAAAFGLNNPHATRTGQIHRAAYIPAIEPGFVFVVGDDCAGNRVRKLTTADARADYARRRASGWTKCAPHVGFVGTDAYARYVHRAELVGRK